MSFKVVFFLLFFFLYLALVAILWLSLTNSGKGSSKEHSCEIYSKSVHLFRSKSFKDVFIFSSEGHLVQWSGTV